jgi:peptidylprolyl isomerase
MILPYEEPLTVRLAADVPAAQRTNLEVLRTDRPFFQKYIDARRNRREEWFIDPVGHIEICNLPVPVRKAH